MSCRSLPRPLDCKTCYQRSYFSTASEYWRTRVVIYEKWRGQNKIILIGFRNLYPERAASQPPKPANLAPTLLTNIHPSTVFSPPNSNHLHRILDQTSIQLAVQRGRRSQIRKRVNLQQPRFLSRIQQNIEAKNLKARSGVRHAAGMEVPHHLRLHNPHRLPHYVQNLKTPLIPSLTHQ